MRPSQNLDSIDFTILKLVGKQPDITTREIEVVIYLSRVQTLRRLKSLEDQGLIIKKNGLPGQTYRYTLTPSVTLEDIVSGQENRDPVAREALKILLHGLRAISAQLNSIIAVLESLLK